MTRDLGERIGFSIRWANLLSRLSTRHHDNLHTNVIGQVTDET